MNGKRFCKTISKSFFRIKEIFYSLISFTPNALIRLFKNRLFIACLTLGIGGIVGNRFDSLFTGFIHWLFEKNSYMNLFVFVFILILILLLWVSFSFVRLHDKVFLNSLKTSSKLRCYSDDFYKELTYLVSNSKYKSDLFISIGEGESLNDWLVRICEESKSDRIKIPQIRNVYIKMLSYDLCKELESSGFILKGFYSRMKNNVNSLTCNHTLGEFGIKVHVSYWKSLPSFHGFIYDKYCFINSWEVNKNGYLHVRTPLREFTAEQNPDEYNDLLKIFKN